MADKELCERLRSGRWLGETTGKQAADRIEELTTEAAENARIIGMSAEREMALRGEVERLRRALERIAALEDDFESNAAMTAHEWQMFHTARAALEGTSDE